MESVLSPSLISALIAFGVFGILMVVMGMKIRQYDPIQVNSNFQNIIELLFDGIGNVVEGILGPEERDRFVPLAITIWSTIFLANIVGLFAMTEAAIDLNYTFTWALMMFVVWNGYGIYMIGIKKFLKDFLQPIPVMAPIEVISFLAKPLSMAMRLFGNILSGYIFMKIVYLIPQLIFGASHIFGVIVAPLFVVAGSVLSVYFSIFGPFLQSMIFTYLTLVNLSLLINEEE